ncbi:flagellar hook-length control protein [Mycobacteroides abscessus subsp. bolletii]|uniref:flagellar hook-length control protein n=1 Tax=Mycobacteroides abscessus TaxID=36809 RepID=UPI00092C3584|nr:flagellar hook-length control protein [Mycobacteroides abscessus]SIJ61645.1 flagellar hook-length control protein [Mycobacteroides abscessus subsp. bolletii]
MTITTTEDIIRAAASVGRDAAEGRLSPDQLEAQARAEVLAIAGEVVGEGDPLWEVQLGIARGVLAAGGVPADELSEWLAVARHRAGEPVNQPVTLPEPISLPSEAHSPESADAAAEPVPEPAAEPVADAEPVLEVVPPRKADGYEPLAGWQPGNSRRY